MLLDSSPPPATALAPPHAPLGLSRSKPGWPLPSRLWHVAAYDEQGRGLPSMYNCTSILGFGIGIGFGFMPIIWFHLQVRFSCRLQDLGLD
jgi:hypothetical protein